MNGIKTQAKSFSIEQYKYRPFFLPEGRRKSARLSKIDVSFSWFPFGKGPFLSWRRQSSGMLVRRTQVRLRATPRFPCQYEKCLLFESETASVPSGISGWTLAGIRNASNYFSKYSRKRDLVHKCKKIRGNYENAVDKDLFAGAESFGVDPR